MEAKVVVSSYIRTASFYIKPTSFKSHMAWWKKKEETKTCIETDVTLRHRCALVSKNLLA